MQLRFDPALPHQQEAIQAVTDLFEGLPMADSPLSIVSVAGDLGLRVEELGFGNAVGLDHDVLLANLQRVQQRNEIPKVNALVEPRFAIEMETGTGKTYVYLRTVFELNRLYGMKKFIVVVPSIPIREGVLHSINTMRSHFRAIYNTPFDHFVYDSSRLTQIRNFATSNTLQIMVINIQAFIRDAEAKDTGRGSGNVIYREFDKLNGLRPIEYIQQTNPIVIVDEPQKVTGKSSTNALSRLNPLATLEYSATFESPNKVYRLGPIEAYEQKLVKQIEVASVLQEADANSAFVKFIQADINKQRTQVEITAGGVTDPKRKKIWIKQGDDLDQKSEGRAEYRNGFRVIGLGWEPGNEYIEFSGGIRITPETTLGETNEAIMRAQIETTIKQHFEREIHLNDLGIKVLSLFFIDKVANYRDYDSDGTARPGKIALWFEEIYKELRLRPRYATLQHGPVESLHDGYFSIDSKRRLTDTSGKTAADEGAYELIMRDKERLLSMSEPLRFIFSHSALREGWDNPNVFQICTLNETRSVDKKRQEIGRGLRLPVNQHGERIHDEHINRLTVIANESYREFAETLQREYEVDAGIRFGIVPRTAFNNVTITNPETGIATPIYESGSNRLFNAIYREGYVDFEGHIQPTFVPDQLGFQLRVPEEFADPITVDQIIDKIKRYVFRDHIIKDARKRERVELNDDVLDNQSFIDFWNTIAQRTRFVVDFDSEELITRAAERIKISVLVSPPRIIVSKARIDQTRAGIREGQANYSTQIESRVALVVPDIITLIQSETNLTRRTIANILIRSGKAEDIRINPQSFITQATAIIKFELQKLMQGGLRYEKREGTESRWNVSTFRRKLSADPERYADRLYSVKNKEKSIFDRIELDSLGVEARFVSALDEHESVKYFVKLPDWFKVDTPFGPYNPDWAIMLLNEQSFYLVRETKGSLDEIDRRGTENEKIHAARIHFKAIDVDYDVSRSFSDVEDYVWRKQNLPFHAVNSDD